jgi:hypothetical protein
MILFGQVGYARLLHKTWTVMQRLWKPATPVVMAQRQIQEPAAVGHSSAASSSSGLRNRRPAVEQQSASAGSAVAAPKESLASDELPRDLLLLGIFWSGLLCLSLVPHQEFRFLLPCTIPLALLIRGDTRDGASRAIAADPAAAAPAAALAAAPPVASRPIRFLSVLHAIVAVVLLGVLHQGGLLRQWMEVRPGATDVPLAAVVYFHTYPTPTAFLHAANSHLETATPILNVHREKHLLTTFLEHTQHLQPGHSVRIRLVMPGSVSLPLESMKITLSRLNPFSEASPQDPHCAHHVCFEPRCEFVWPHLTLDEPPKLLGPPTSHPPSRSQVAYLSADRRDKLERRCTDGAAFTGLGLATYEWMVVKA